MLRLIILRHSKAVAQAPGGDVERMLTERARTDASRIGEYLRDEKLVPDLALTSRAKRAEETLELALHQIRNAIPITKKKRLYLATPRVLLAVVRETPAHVRTLLVVGHNPGLAAFANELTGSGDTRARAAMAVHFPTTALAVLVFDLANWTEVDFGEARLDRFVTPASLGADEEE